MRDFLSRYITYCIAPWGALTPGGRLRFLEKEMWFKDEE
jgi:hypothetical protein